MEPIKRSSKKEYDVFDLPEDFVALCPCDTHQQSDGYRPVPYKSAKVNK
jgi:hypothetical protein